jgi:hypothetical protein
MGHGAGKQKGQKVCRRDRSFLGLRWVGETEGTEDVQKKQKFFWASRGWGNRRDRRFTEETEVFWGFAVIVQREEMGVPSGYSGRKTNIFYT